MVERGLQASALKMDVVVRFQKSSADANRSEQGLVV